MASEAVKLDPERIRRPVPWEPLFERAAERGYAWEACNVLDASTHRLTDPPRLSGAHIDWFLARGLEAADPIVLEAFDADTQTTLSDHEPIAVSVRPG